jgi:hypothetical protein
MDHLCNTIVRVIDQEIPRQAYQSFTTFINISIELVTAPYTGTSSVARSSWRAEPVIKMAASNGSYEL